MLNKRPVELDFTINGTKIHIKFPAVGETIDVSKKVADNYSNTTAFNYFLADFGTFFNKIRNSEVPYNRAYDSENLNIFEIDSNQNIDAAFNVIKYFANVSSNYHLSRDEAQRILHAYETIFTAIADEYEWINADAFIVPLRGGGVVARLFELPEDKVIHLNAKRLPIKDVEGHFYFGMDAGYGDNFRNIEGIDSFMNSLSDKKVTILEICVASGMTTYGFLLDLYARNVKPKVVKVVAAAISVQGARYIKKLSALTGIEVEFITGKVVNKLADHYQIEQDPLLDTDGKFLVKSPAKAYELLYNTSIT